MSNEELADIVLASPSPKVTIGPEGKPVLHAKDASYAITMDQADLLFSTMFFRSIGKAHD